MDEIKNYIYIDEQGIDSIYSQLHKETVEEMRIKKTKTNSGSINIIKGLIKGEHTSSTECDKLVSLTHEQKICEIIKIVSKNKNYFTDLNKATNNNLKPSNGIIIVNIQDTFYCSLDFNTREAYDYMKNSGYIGFEKGDLLISPTPKSIPKKYETYNYRDDYYKDSRYKVIFSMNLQKMKTSMGLTSHLPMAIRYGNGKIKLGVFGQLRTINDLFFQIKPFAVWW